MVSATECVNDVRVGDEVYCGGSLWRVVAVNARYAWLGPPTGSGFGYYQRVPRESVIRADQRDGGRQ